MHDDVIRNYMNKMLNEEIIPILPLDKDDCLKFASAVEDRFNNPFVDHQLMSISLNSTSKWKARNMPSFLEYVDKFGKLPPVLSMSLAAYIAFYSNDLQRREADGLIAKRPLGNEYKIQDDAWALDFFWERKDASVESLVHDVLSNTQMWDQDLTQIPGFEELTVKNLKLIREKGAEEAYASVL
jgi:tagaturonate reductase